MEIPDPLLSSDINHFQNIQNNNQRHVVGMILVLVVFEMISILQILIVLIFEPVLVTLVLIRG